VAKPALVLGDEAIDHDELDRRVTRMAHAFTDRGVGRGDRVAVMLPSGFEFFVAALATAKCQASLIPVNWHLKREEVDWIISDSAAKVLVTTDDVPDSDDESPIADGFPTPALMFYTSGTTGRPKGVVHGEASSARLTFVQDMLSQLWGFTADEVHLLSGPPYHAGPGGYAFSALYNGGTVVILPTWDAVEWLRLVDHHKVTSTFMTPAHFIRILEVPEDQRAKFDVASMRLILHGGAPCPIPVKERIIDALMPAEVYELYGASEGGATRISSSEWKAKPGSVGTPWPGVEIRVLDAETSEPKATGEDGLIYITPPGGAQFHYHNDPAKTSGAWRDGAFTVGDIGHLDADGHLYITDRLSDMVIRGGVNIYPREIEEVLHRHPAVVDCAVFGVPDDRYGEALKAVVETRSAVGTDDLQSFVRGHLADFKCPTMVEFVDELPRDPNGKVLKRLLKQQG
jgi:long-chain acyl-CoA synthetase